MDADGATCTTRDGTVDDEENEPLVARRQADQPRAGASESSLTSVEEGTGSLVAAMVITVVLVPLPAVLSAAYGVPVPAARTCAVALLMAAYWSLEPLPLAVTALLPVVLLPALGVLPASQVAVRYMNSSNLLFLGNLFVAAAVEQSGLHYRLALSVLRIVGTQWHKLLLGFMGSCGLLSMFISNSATAACMLPIARKLLQTVGQRQGASDELDRASQRFQKGLLLGVAYACSLGGMASLTGTGTNIAFAGFWSDTYGTKGSESLTFGRWILFAFPLSGALVLVVWLVLCARFIGLHAILRQQRSGQADSVSAAVIDAEARALGPMSTREKTVLVHFFGQTLLWLTRDLGGGFGWGKLFEDGYVSDATVAMTTACSLFMMPTGSSSTGSDTRCTTARTMYEHASTDGGTEVLPILRPESELDGKSAELGSTRDRSTGGAAGGSKTSSVRVGNKPGKKPLAETPEVDRCLDGNAIKSVDWGVVLLLGGGFALAHAFDESGLSAYLGLYVMAPLEELPLAMVIVGVCTVMTLLTEFTSNVASVSVALPLLASAAERMEVSPVLLLVPATCAASCAFMLPVATPPNAVVFAGGGLAVKDMLVSGLVANTLAVGIICVYTPTVAPYIFDM
eukprot:COSAG02_NODE_1907_length_10423_cov_22.481596_4_plen_626_part_00